MLILISAIRGAIMLIAFVHGIPIHTIRDISVNVINVTFDFIIPFVGGVLLFFAGVMIQRVQAEVSVHAATRIYEKRSKAKNDKIISKMLNKNDLMIIEMLRKNKTMLQSDIVSMSGFSKVKVHRILRKLEIMDIIRSSRFGITNRIMLINDRTSDFQRKA
ncbi:winged helix-turn-helix transcriptional regulator [Candidatus Marsarchaeota archaeon]|nr:winged helix-turn-helix transcriptional regulator [Candidatus Marsarchaeota archaeon]MCL5404955.1 winged helix-turn-helix transcriptional regulator [Candidatus Marsarchaeota archaeon]